VVNWVKIDIPAISSSKKSRSTTRCHIWTNGKRTRPSDGLSRQRRSK